jgi:hypothetical protein
MIATNEIATVLLRGPHMTQSNWQKSNIHQLHSPVIKTGNSTMASKAGSSDWLDIEDVNENYCGLGARIIQRIECIQTEYGKNPWQIKTNYYYGK